MYAISVSVWPEINERHPITFPHESFDIFTLVKLSVGESDFKNLAPLTIGREEIGGLKDLKHS